MSERSKFVRKLRSGHFFIHTSLLELAWCFLEGKEALAHLIYEECSVDPCRGVPASVPASAPCISGTLAN